MERKNNAIAAAAAEKGLSVRGVFNISGVMKKTGEEIERDAEALTERIALPARSR